MSNVSVEWDQVFADPNARNLLRDFVSGNRGFRGTIRSFKSATARTELYRLERNVNADSARRRIRGVLSRRSS
jgi:hypothetical protein